MTAKIPIGILGATGIVGQRFVQLLEHHPWFEVAWLAASDRSEGRLYADAARWKLKTAIPKEIAEMRVAPATPENAPKVIFAALDASIAAEMEPRFAEAGCAVITNSSALRMQKDVPLVIPEVNHDHVKLLECQAWRKKSGGFVVTNPNCSAIGLVIAQRARVGDHRAPGFRKTRLHLGCDGGIERSENNFGCVLWSRRRNSHLGDLLGDCRLQLPAGGVRVETALGTIRSRQPRHLKPGMMLQQLYEALPDDTGSAQDSYRDFRSHNSFLGFYNTAASCLPREDETGN